MSILCIIIMSLLILQAIAFITVYERHLLSLTQNRMGPTVVSLKGVLQAIMDGLKLMKKEQLLVNNSSLFLFLFVPSVAFILMLMEWMVLNYNFSFMTFQYSLMMFLCMVGFSVYTTMISGVVSKSKYPSLGSIRSSSQSISFEIAFSIYIFSIMFFVNSYYFIYNFNFLMIFIWVPFLLMMLAELNRAPFDFSEGESELVSGFNVEYSSVAFIFLFLGEYGVLIFFSVMFSVFFGYMYFYIYFFMFSLLIFIRSSYPRYRYDMLMNFFWFKLLPLSILMLFFYYMLMMY